EVFAFWIVELAVIEDADRDGPGLAPDRVSGPPAGLIVIQGQDQAAGPLGDKGELGVGDDGTEGRHGGIAGVAHDGGVDGRFDEDDLGAGRYLAEAEQAGLDRDGFRLVRHVPAV